MIAERARMLTSVFITAALSCGIAVAQAEGPKVVDPEEVLRRARAAFKAADHDGDNKVTRDEFLASYQQAERNERIRLFSEFDVEGDGIFKFDFEADGTLDRNEFLKLVSPTDDRAAIADPMTELAEADLTKWQAEIAAADRDGDGALTRDEWPARRIAAALPAVAKVTFEQWDRNHDRKVDVAEAKWLLEVAYGLTRLDGGAVRKPTGRVFSWYFFRSLDSNHDAALSRHEFVGQLFLGKEKNAILFDKLDADRDGKLTAEETWRFLWHDTLANFFTFDRDLDGFMTTDEFLAIGWGKNLALRSVRAFDADADGRLSFSEFRSTTFANQASDWLRPRRDLNHDGLLSFDEFYLEDPPLLIAQSRFFFDHFDLNKDDALSPTEFDFDGGFAAADADHDGQLTLDELIEPLKDSERADRKRQFLVFDFDGNGKLDATEYDNISAPVDERVNVPDPMAEFADAALAKWEAILTAADRDQDGALSPAEWPAKLMTNEIPALAEVPFQLWDRGRDGKVNRADARRLIDVAYGLQQLDGRPLRTSTGRMFAWYFFRRHDANHDDLMSRNEFVACYRPPNVNTAELFEKLDADGDGQLTQQETWPVFCHDTIAAFLDYDRNHDGYLTADEVRSIGWGWMLARRTVPVFDDDGDGKLSFREFRLTNFANQASDWWQLRDLDNDGRLSWKEFYREKSPLLIGQSRFYFDRYDRNQDGFLSAFEFPSEADPTHGQIIAYANMLERVLPLEVQFAGHVCALTEPEAVALEREGHTAIEQLVEESFSTPGKSQNNFAGGMMGGGMMGGGRPITGTNLQILRSPHLVLRRELAKSLRSNLVVARDVWQKIDAERVLVENRRKKAAALEHVAMLDEILFLSAAQRHELGELLAGEASDGWWQQINSIVILPQTEQVYAVLSGNGFFGLFVPEAELAKRLTATQLAVFQNLQQPQEQEVDYAQQAAPKPAPVAPANLDNNAGAAKPRARAAAPAGRVLPAPVAAGMAGGMMGGQPNVRRRFLRQGPTAEVQERRLTQYIDERLDDIHRACDLTEALRAKLLLAAKLDLARLREQLSSRPLDKLNEGEELVTQKMQVRWPTPLPLEIFRGPESHFQKTLQGRLLDDQKKKLAAADAERRAFQRRALVETVVAGFERAAALTAEQCETLAKLFNDAIAEVEAESVDDWRCECLRRMAQLPSERLQPLLLDFQQAGAQQQHTQLIENARQMDAARGNAAMAAVPASP